MSLGDRRTLIGLARLARLLGLGVALCGACPLAEAQTVVELQPGRHSDAVPLHDAQGHAGRLMLTQLHPRSNAWLLLTLQAPALPGQATTQTYHLENADPAGQQVLLDPALPGQLRLSGRDGVTDCGLWPGRALAQAAASRLPYAPLCGGRLYLRNAVTGHRSTLEATTEFLRDHVWGGERIVGFVKREFYRDAFVERAGSAPDAAAAQPAAPPEPAGAPPPAKLSTGQAPGLLRAEGLGLDLGASNGPLWPGRWYAAAGLDAVFVSVVQPGMLAGRPGRATGLDAVEAQALAYLVAFDLSTHDLVFALGTEHPRLGWSPRVRPEQRDERLAGPDGIADAAPLVRTGQLAPPLLARAVASFTGGFKREHGAFRSGALSTVNHGSHYGFVEQGVVFSTLQRGLATLLVGDDGTVEMKTWQRDDERRLARLRYARQNGVALVEPGPAGGTPVFGALVEQWGAGNWSGSAQEQLRTLRAGACLIGQGERRYLVYGYFSAATPRAMAQVFRAYGCHYAMHLDMNALEHTYLALYPGGTPQRGIEHLVPGMAVLDAHSGSLLLPRFLAVPDSRDFFVLLARRSPR